MQKLAMMVLITLSLCFFHLIRAHAQNDALTESLNNEFNDSFFKVKTQQPTPAPSARKVALTPPANPIISSGDFTKKVEALNAQTTEQVKQQMSNQATSQPASPEPDAPKTVETPPAETQPTQAGAPTPPAVNNAPTVQQPPSASPTSPSSTPAGSLNQQNTTGSGYTGFGTGNSGTSAPANTGSSKSTGWGVKY